MKNVSIAFETVEELESLIHEHGINDSARLLLQLFCARVDREFIESFQNFLNQKLPLCSLIGTTTDGVINDSEIYYDTKNVLTFSIFEDTDLKTKFVIHGDSENCSYDTGIAIASALKNKDVKTIICFADGLNINGEEFVDAIETVMPDVIVAGGLAGDNGELKNTLVFDRKEISNRAAVAVALINPNLFVGSNYSFNWIPIGKKMRVTKSVKNRVYELDGQPIVDVYAKYMGKDLIEQLPHIGIEFPLMLQKGDVTVGRAVIGKNDDGSMTFAGNIDEFEIVRFGVGDIESILNDATHTANSLLQKNNCRVEAVFIYSCMARRRFLDKYAHKEIESISHLGTASGFFTYGEFFHSQGKNQFLNGTMTYLMLYENCDIKYSFRLAKKKTDTTIIKTTQQVLANLANTISNELAELNENLEQRVRESSTYIFKQAYFDKLTGLPNRISLIDSLDNHLGETIVLINVDNFSTINDFYGYKVGDQLLKQIATTVQEYATDYNFKAFKLPADEFALIVNIKKSKTDLEKYIKELAVKIEKYDYTFGDHSIHVGITIAAAVINAEKTGMVNADMTLKLAKSKRKSFMIFNEELHLARTYEQNIKIANKIKTALDTGNMIPYYQPIVDVQTLEIVKYEALVRLRDIDGTILPPSVFLEASRKIRLNKSITKAMIEQTFSFFSKNGLDFSLNMDFADIASESVREFLYQKLIEYNVAEQLTIEVLETQEFEDPNIVLDFVENICKHKVKVAIDDFGSGYANFEYVTNIRNDFVKIDGSLIKKIDEDKNARIITETITEFAKKLGKKVVAEYVHSKEVFEVVKELGIDYAQGYYFSEPKEFI
ncbi:EAL domain-containing protein [Sulfurimonas sp. C5]|uniref:EAL domain-containing protein n=1 Tax=Sulfurimonas sp. C5 TaxID=3036947 RepID=UPI002458B872|nr:EAL domain-containing protein [Sulfurimonas sp. C5]MDH4945155.1 EAL domain-containing protein [Sulfurimonas sp. C5]